MTNSDNKVLAAIHQYQRIQALEMELDRAKHQLDKRVKSFKDSRELRIYFRAMQNSVAGNSLIMPSEYEQIAAQDYL